MSQTNEKEGRAYRLMTATDIHYLSSSLYDGGTAFQKMMTTNDGKLVERGDEILSALTDQVIAEKPDAFLFTGDLTFNGELVSLQEVKKALEEIEAEGIRVLVVPGNHDIAYSMAARYEGDVIYREQNISQSDFRKEMAEFGITDALSSDPESFSYVCELADDLRIIAIDANTEGGGGLIRTTTLAWLEEQLKEAQKEGKSVITMSHQNVLAQSSFMTRGFRIANGDKVAGMLRKYGVKLHLSGHSHLQHTTTEDGLTDICTESLSVYPLQYGTVLYDTGDNTFSYENSSLGIYQDEALKCFEATIERSAAPMLDELYLSSENREAMMAFAKKFNAAYFSGNTAEIVEFGEENGWHLWEKFGSSTFWYMYIKNVMNEFQ